MKTGAGSPSTALRTGGVCGVRVALMMPVEPVANWVFRLTEPVEARY